MSTHAIAGVEVSDPAGRADRRRPEPGRNIGADAVTSDYQFVDEISLHLIDAGGKRFRPLFTLLARTSAPGQMPTM